VTQLDQLRRDLPHVPEGALSAAYRRCYATRLAHRHPDDAALLAADEVRRRFARYTVPVDLSPVPEVEAATVDRPRRRQHRTATRKHDAAILAALVDGPRRSYEVAEAVGLTRSNTSDKLTRLKHEGRVRKVGFGVWALAGAVEVTG
jgi:predicted Rossmann fold nucleotide-binding protein DprA/Smf involved in DNA uptake